MSDKTAFIAESGLLPIKPVRRLRASALVVGLLTAIQASQAKAADSYGAPIGPGGALPNGPYATAIGYGAVANEMGTSLGYLASAFTQESTAVGYGARADSGANASAFGFQANAEGPGSVAIGTMSHANSLTGSSIAIGAESEASGGGIAIGPLSQSTGEDTIAMGHETTATHGSAMALGDTAIATGNGSTAVGPDAIALASDGGGGYIQQATADAFGFRSYADGSQAAAIGNNSGAIGANATTVRGWALGAQATSLGTDSISNGDMATAVGARAHAFGDTATAFGAQTSATAENASAFGVNAIAAASGSTALGSGASTGNFTNATALGVGAAATANDQMMLGTSATTYAAPGVNSALSHARQSGPTKFVSADANGNLATSAYGPDDINNFNNSINVLALGLNSVSQEVKGVQREARQGIAMAMAAVSAPMPSAPGRTSWVVNGAYYKSAGAIAGTMAHRLPTAAPLAATAGVSVGLRNSVAVRGGLIGEF